MFKTARNIIVIVVAVLIFIFFFAGMGVFDDILPLVQTKSAILLETNSDNPVIDMDKYGYIAKKDNKDNLIEYMLNDGYKLVSISDNEYIFEKDGKNITYGSEEFLWRYIILKEKEG